MFHSLHLRPLQNWKRFCSSTHIPFWMAALLQLTGSSIQPQNLTSKQSFEGSSTSQSLLTSSRSSCQNITVKPRSIPRKNSEVVNQILDNISPWDVRSMPLKNHLGVPSSFFFSFRIPENTFLAIQGQIRFRSRNLTKMAIEETMMTKIGGNAIIRLYSYRFISSVQLVKLRYHGFFSQTTPVDGLKWFR